MAVESKQFGDLLPAGAEVAKDSVKQVAVAVEAQAAQKELHPLHVSLHSSFNPNRRSSSNDIPSPSSTTTEKTLDAGSEGDVSRLHGDSRILGDRLPSGSSASDTKHGTTLSTSDLSNVNGSSLFERKSLAALSGHSRGDAGVEHGKNGLSDKRTRKNSSRSRASRSVSPAAKSSPGENDTHRHACAVNFSSPGGGVIAASPVDARAGRRGHRHTTSNVSAVSDITQYSTTAGGSLFASSKTKEEDGIQFGLPLASSPAKPTVQRAASHSIVGVNEHSSVHPPSPVLPFRSENEASGTTSQRSSGGKKKKSTHWYQALHPNYKYRSEEFKRYFKLNERYVMPYEERLLVDYSCALQRDILCQGRMYCSQYHLCFRFNIFGIERTYAYLWTQIASIYKDKTAKIIPNAISVRLVENGEHLFFTTFNARDKAFAMLSRLWQSANAVAAENAAVSATTSSSGSCTTVNSPPVSSTNVSACASDYAQSSVAVERSVQQPPPLTSDEIWSLVHFSYGDDLGLTTDDDDYVPPAHLKYAYKDIHHKKKSTKSQHNAVGTPSNSMVTTIMTAAPSDTSVSSSVADVETTSTASSSRTKPGGAEWLSRQQNKLLRRSANNNYSGGSSSGSGSRKSHRSHKPRGSTPKHAQYDTTHETGAAAAPQPSSTHSLRVPPTSSQNDSQSSSMESVEGRSSRSAAEAVVGSYRVKTTTQRPSTADTTSTAASQKNFNGEAASWRAQSERDLAGHHIVHSRKTNTQSADERLVMDNDNNDAELERDSDDISSAADTTTDNDEEFIAEASIFLPVVLPEVPGLLLLDDEFDLSVDQVFVMLFSDNMFCRDFFALRGFIDLHLGSWGDAVVPSDAVSSAAAAESIHERVITYRVKAMPGQWTTTVERQLLLPESINGRVYLIDTEVRNSGVMYSDAFFVRCHYALAALTGDNSCRLRVHGELIFLKRILLARSMIESRVFSTLREHFARLRSALYETTRDKVPKLANSGVPMAANNSTVSAALFGSSLKDEMPELHNLAEPLPTSHASSGGGSGSKRKTNTDSVPMRAKSSASRKSQQQTAEAFLSTNTSGTSSDDAVVRRLPRSETNDEEEVEDKDATLKPQTAPPVSSSSKSARRRRRYEQQQSSTSPLSSKFPSHEDIDYAGAESPSRRNRVVGSVRTTTRASKTSPPSSPLLLLSTQQTRSRPVLSSCANHKCLACGHVQPVDPASPTLFSSLARHFTSDFGSATNTILLCVLVAVHLLLLWQLVLPRSFPQHVLSKFGLFRTSSNYADSGVKSDDGVMLSPQSRHQHHHYVASSLSGLQLSMNAVRRQLGMLLVKLAAGDDAAVFAANEQNQD